MHACILHMEKENFRRCARIVLQAFNTVTYPILYSFAVSHSEYAFLKPIDRHYSFEVWNPFHIPRAHRCGLQSVTYVHVNHVTISDP